MSNRPAILFVSKPAREGERKGYTLMFDAITMELLEVIEEPYCKMHSNGNRIDTKYIPNYEDLQHNIVIIPNSTEL
jgi:hypothetical protein